MAYAPTRAAAARSTRPAAWAALPLLSLLAALLAPSPAHGCTVFELMSSGFAANAVHLMHAEAVFGGGERDLLYGSTLVGCPCRPTVALTILPTVRFRKGRMARTRGYCMLDLTGGAVHCRYMETCLTAGMHCWQAGVNGTFFVDASAFAYRCSDGGGWHDFFDVQPEVLVPWSAAREAAEGEPCVRHTFDSVDALLDSRFHIGWDSWDQAGAMRVCALYEPA